MKYLVALLLVSSCSTLRSPSSVDELETISFRDSRLTKKFLRKSYAHLDEKTFETKFELSLERPLLFYRSYVNSFYTETTIKGALNRPGNCLGDAHPENFGFISFHKKPFYVFNDIDDSGTCPIGLDILRYFSALKLTDISQDDFERLAHLFESYVNGNQSEDFQFNLPNLARENELNIQKYISDNKFLNKPNIELLPSKKKKMIQAFMKEQMPALEVLDVASYTKSDGGSAGLKRYWLLLKDRQGHKELVEFKEQTTPAVSWSGVAQDHPREATPQLVWGTNPDYYGYLFFEDTLFLTRTRADSFIDMGKLSADEQFKLLSYQVFLIAKFHQANLQSIGGIKAQWIINNSLKVSERYLEAFKAYK